VGRVIPSLLPCAILSKVEALSEREPLSFRGSIFRARRLLPRI